MLVYFYVYANRIGLFDYQNCMYISVDEHYIIGQRYDNSICLGKKSIAWSNLNLLEQLFGITRGTIKVDFARKKLSLASYEDVARYISDKCSRI